MDVDIEVLRYFQQVADGLTVTETADVFRITQPAVSRSLKRLEAEVGAPLLERVGRGLRLTHAGKAFKAHLDGALHQLDDGIAAVEELLDPATGTVRVAFQPSLGTWLVPAVVASFRQRHPSVRVNLMAVGDPAGSTPVLDGLVDLQFTARRPRHPEVTWQRLIRQPLGLAVPPTHRLASRTAADLQEFAEDDFVMLHPAWELRTLVNDLCSRAGFVPRVTFEEDDMLVVRGFVTAGLGVTVVPQVPSDTFRSNSGAERLIALRDATAFREVGVAWSSERRLLPSAILFREHAALVSSQMAH